MQDLLTTAQAAQVLDVSERMVHYYVREQRLKVAHRIGRALLFRPMDVAELKPTILRRNFRAATELAVAAANREAAESVRDVA